MHNCFECGEPCDCGAEMDDECTSCSDCDIDFDDEDIDEDEDEEE